MTVPRRAAVFLMLILVTLGVYAVSNRQPVLVASSTPAVSPSSTGDEVGRRTAPTVKPSLGRSVTPTQPEPLVFTYFFYWYDAGTGQHMTPLADHPVSPPRPSWHNVDWYTKELTDMRYAGIDVVLPVYWGSGEVWSTNGLGYLVQARDQVAAGGGGAPAVGMFFDTTILGSRDLTQPANMALFYANVKDFYSRIPARMWVRVQGRPVVWLYWPPVGITFNQAVFDYTYDSFTRDFGIRPYIVSEVRWECAVTGWNATAPVQDCTHRIGTDASYEWNVAYNGYWGRGTVAAVGPGYNESGIAGRRGVVRPRAGGEWYRTNFEKAAASKRRLLVIETWNEFHEASDVSESVEYGRTYVEYTRQGVAAYRGYLAAHP
ncbi:MAG: DUF5010 domain-containing protein [Candidatus Dormibacteraeota bacterium]|nr:DUF5010 domain-containing protein [Candidatus Dormibacteraeota bacterium]